MKTHRLSPLAFKIRLIFLLLLVSTSIIMELLSVFNPEEINLNPAPKVQTLGKEIMYELPQRPEPIILDGLAVVLKNAFVLNRSEKIQKFAMK